MGNFLQVNLVEIGIFIAIVSYVVTYWKQGGGQASAAVIAAYKEQVTINAGKISELTHDLGVLTGQVREKDERIRMLEALVQGKDPSQQQYMTDMRAFTRGVAEYMAGTTKTLGEISVFLHDLNKA